MDFQKEEVLSKLPLGYWGVMKSTAKCVNKIALGEESDDNINLMSFI